MTDLHARLVAEIQQVRTTTPRECLLGCMPNVHSPWCDERWLARGDARLAACVEAMLDATGATMQQHPENAWITLAAGEAAGLAAFLAAAAQKETK